MSDEDTTTPRHFGATQPMSDQKIDRAPDDNDDDLVLTDLDQIATEVQEEVSRGVLTLPVQGRDGWSVTFNLDIEIGWLERWRKRAHRGPKDSGYIDIAHFNSLILANTCVAINKGGRRVVDSSGPLVFNSDGFIQLCGALDVQAAIKHWYGVDAHVAQTANAVLEEAGFGEEIEREDPTMR